MKEQKKLTFLIRFGLGDLKLVDIGTNFIKIGPEMPILELFVMHIQKSSLSPNSGSVYLLEKSALTTFRKVDCGIGSRSNLGAKDPKPQLPHIYTPYIMRTLCHNDFSTLYYTLPPTPLCPLLAALVTTYRINFQGVCQLLAYPLPPCVSLCQFFATPPTPLRC